MDGSWARSRVSGNEIFLYPSGMGVDTTRGVDKDARVKARVRPRKQDAVGQIKI